MKEYVYIGYVCFVELSHAHVIKSHPKINVHVDYTCVAPNLQFI